MVLMADLSLDEGDDGEERLGERYLSEVQRVFEVRDREERKERKEKNGAQVATHMVLSVMRRAFSHLVYLPRRGV